MSEITKLEPQAVWNEFLQIAQVPRPSKHEEKIIAYLLEWAEKHDIEAHKDDAGNILMRKPATPGFEGRKSIILQSHVDMVCEKNSDVKHDFMTDPIESYVEGNWVKAKGTTLGADDGIGCAAQLAILASKDIEHGPIECLFTVDEETGLTGAFALQAGFFNSQILLNLDSEDEGELFIGCAGGIDTVATFPYNTIGLPAATRNFKLTVSGLKGGHSGDDIHKGLGNAIKILARMLKKLNDTLGVFLISFEGGNLRNALAREAVAAFAINEGMVEKMQELVAAFRDEMKAEYHVTEPNLSIEVQPTDAASMVFAPDSFKRLLELIYALPHGVIEMSREIQGLVETSTNLASVRKAEGNNLFLTTSQRSSVNSCKEYVADMVESVFLLAGCKTEHSDGYPGWAPNTQSPILDVTVEAYKRLFNEEPIVRAIHAGLECGLFLEKYPTLDMVSFGPTIRGAHSPDERIDIQTTKKFWELLLEVLRNAPTA